MRHCSAVDCFSSLLPLEYFGAYFKLLDQLKKYADMGWGRLLIVRGFSYFRSTLYTSEVLLQIVSSD